MNTQEHTYLTGWSHFSHEQENVYLSDFVLKLPNHHPQMFPKFESIRIHWSGKPSQEDIMIKVRTAFFLCTQKMTEITRARKDFARFSLRKGMAIGLKGRLSPKYISLFTSQYSWKASSKGVIQNGFQSLYVLSPIQGLHEFFGSLPGWQISIQTTAHSAGEALLLGSLWKIGV